MSEYKIERWDVVMFNNSLTKVPMIYIKPDLTFLEFARNNNFAVACEISGTETVYDGKIIPGVVDKSYNVPNCRPNFYEKTGFYVITLWANWYGYPEPGKLVIFLNEDDAYHSVSEMKNFKGHRYFLYGGFTLLANRNPFIKNYKSPTEFFLYD